MNNIGVLLGESISIIKKSSLFIATILSIFSTTTSNTPSNNSNQMNLGISNSVQKQAIENTNKIINVLNQENLTTSISVDKNIKKLNALNIVAPVYKNIPTGNTKDSSTTTKLIVSTQNTKGDSGIGENNVFIKQKSVDDSVVNIRCENKTSNTLKIITGSGVLISSSGLILTAAHVAAPVYAKQKGDNQYTCVARIKNPATGGYPLKVVFVDPIWVSKYYSMFDKDYSETGENDIALLQIDSNQSTKINESDITKLNNTSYAPLNPTSSIDSGSGVVIKAYPSDVYGKFGVFATLPRQSETTSLESLLNFDGNTNAPYDLLETKPSSLGQSGASGGGIFNDQGQLIGIISNTIPSDILSRNKIRALSLSYIDKQIKNNLGVSIFEYNK